MRTAVFLVKNGIGYGHIRRALLLAERVRAAGHLRPVVISQAHTLDLLRTAQVPVLNLPLLHRVPSAVSEDCYLEILEAVLARLDPAVVVEDTYPDVRYGALTALHGVPRLLVLRRLDGLTFDQLRTRGAFARYERILIAQDEHELMSEGHSGDSLAAIRYSDRIRLVGNIHYLPHADAVDRVRDRLRGAPLVVVSAGAGGDQLADGFGDRLFRACHHVAGQLRAEGHPARFVLVTGPYYAGAELPETKNVTVQRFTPELPALLAAADVAVIKPGNNVLSEALSGSANLVLVPDASFMEGVHGHAARTAERHGGIVTSTAVGDLEAAIRAALAKPSRRTRPARPDDAIEKIDAAIHSHAAETEPPPVAPRTIGLVLQLPEEVSIDGAGSSARVSILGPDVASGIDRLSEWGGGSTCSAVILADDVPAPGVQPQHIVDQGGRLLLSTGPELNAAVRRWLALEPPRPSLLWVATTSVRLRSPDPTSFLRVLASQLAKSVMVAMVLDVTAFDSAKVHEAVRRIEAWIRRQPVRLATPDDLIRERATELLEGDR